MASRPALPQLASAPAHPPAPRPLPGRPRSCGVTRVSKRALCGSPPADVELGKSRDAGLLQRDLELPWRERFPTPDTEHSKQVYENRGVPPGPCPTLSSSPASRPARGSHLTLRMESNQRKARPRGEDPSIQIQSPRSSAGPGRGGDTHKLRGAAKGSPGIQTTAAERQARGTAAGERCQSRLGDAAGGGQLPTRRSPWVSGLQAQDGEKTRKKKKRKTKQKKKNPTETNRTPEECNVTTPSWRALQGRRSWVSNAVNSFRVIPPSTLPCNSDPSVEV